MSRSWAGGSTRAWRRLRRYVLERDGYRCRVVVDEATGQLCGTWADTAGHVIAKADGGQDTAENLRAECRRHNFSGGAAAAARRRPSWSW